MEEPQTYGHAIKLLAEIREVRLRCKVLLLDTRPPPHPSPIPWLQCDLSSTRQSPSFSLPLSRRQSPSVSPPFLQTLLSFLLPGHGRLRSRIEEVLDLPLIQQQAENGALDIGALSQFIVGMMGSLCAPARDGDIGKLKEIPNMVPLLK